MTGLLSNLQIKNLSAQAGISRIAWSGDAFLSWKANLTALSQSESLYFIALNESIYVDRPSYPEQKLSTEHDIHDLRWQLPKSGHQASRGHHNTRYPHGVNRLEVGELGNLEVLVCACDDGDVIIYGTTDVKAAFMAIDAGMAQAKAVHKFLKPLYIYNVGISAWGIALHKEARLIAISNNGYNIDITAVALSLSENSNSSHTINEIPPIKLPGALQKLDRSIDVRWSLSAHQANIPNVAFFAEEDENSNIYLLSSDIECNVIVWDISAGSRIIHKVSPPRLDVFHQYGWIALPVSHRTFRLTDAESELNGFEKHLGCHQEALYVSERTNVLHKKLPCCIVHTRSYQVSLISNESSRTLTGFMSPWREHERGPPFEGPRLDFGTLKYARHIPELGVVIVASDAGYAGIFTLTRLRTEENNSSDSEKIGMRLDCILPFDNQVPPLTRRVRGLNLWSGLIGISSAPMQGSLKKSFRLILEYGDRTVLCYELFRESFA